MISLCSVSLGALPYLIKRKYVDKVRPFKGALKLVVLGDTVAQLTITYSTYQRPVECGPEFDSKSRSFLDHSPSLTHSVLYGLFSLKKKVQGVTKVSIFQVKPLQTRNVTAPSDWEAQVPNQLTRTTYL